MINNSVFLKEVQTILGEPPSAGLFKLCSSININPDSKYKPVAFGNEHTEEDTWKADGDCGFTVPVIKTSSAKLYELIGPYMLDNAEWKYNRVDPAKHWCRLADFRGYASKTTPMFSKSTDRIEIKQGEASVSVTVTASSRLLPGSLTMSNFKSITDNNLVYFGAFLYGYSGTHRYQRVVSNTSYLGGSIANPKKCTFTFDTFSLPVGTYRIYYFFSDTPLSTLDPDEEITIVPAHRLKPTDVVISKSDVTYDVSIKNLSATLQFGICKPSVTIVNNSSIDITISDLSFAFYTNVFGTTPDFEVQADRVLSIAKGASYTYNYPLIWNVGEVQRTSKVAVTFTVAGQTYTKSQTILISNDL